MLRYEPSSSGKLLRQQIAPLRPLNYHKLSGLASLPVQSMLETDPRAAALPRSKAHICPEDVLEA